MTDINAPTDLGDYVDETTGVVENVFKEMTARRDWLLEAIKTDQNTAKEAYLRIAGHRAELATVNRLLSAAKPRNRKEPAKPRRGRRAKTQEQPDLPTV